MEQNDLSVVLNTLGHDLRGPLFTAHGFLQLVLRQTEGKALELAEHSMRSLEEAMRMVEGILRWARTLGDRLEPATFELSLAANEVLEETRHIAQKKDATVKVGELPTAYGDRRAVTYAISGLVDNAIRYGPEGATVALEGGADDKTWWITVTDKGPGITGDLDALREPFWTVSTRSSSNGIALAHRIATLLQGQLTFTTGPEGTVARLEGRLDA